MLLHLHPRGIAFGLGAALSVLVFAHLLFSLPRLWSAWQDLAMARRIELLNRASSRLCAQANAIAFERGRVNVVLRFPGPAENVAQDRAFILARRQASDGDWQAAQTALSALDGLPRGSLDLLRADMARQIVMDKARGRNVDRHRRHHNAAAVPLP